MTGWRIGWLIGTPEVVAAARKAISATITHVPLVTQHAALAALRDPETPARAAANYGRSRDLLVDRLQSIPGVACPRPAGGMFAFPDVSGLLASGRLGTPRDWQGGCSTTPTSPSYRAACSARTTMCGSASPSAAKGWPRPPTASYPP